MILNNIEKAFVHLYNNAEHEVQNFGNVTIAYAKVENADFNLIMNLNSSSTLREDGPDIEKALGYAASQPHPFAFVQLRKKNYDLSDITSRHKFQLAGQANCVVLDHAEYTYIPAVSSEHRLVKVCDAKSLNDWGNVLDSSFSLKPGCGSFVYQPALSFITEENSSVELYTLYNSANLPTSAAMIYFDPNSKDVAGHYCWGTKAEFRNHGAMTYLTNEMVNISKKRGYKQSTAQCYDTSIRLAQKLGFKASGDMFDIYISSV